MRSGVKGTVGMVSSPEIFTLLNLSPFLPVLLALGLAGVTVCANGGGRFSSDRIGSRKMSPGAFDF